MGEDNDMVAPGTLGDAYDTVTALYTSHPGTMVELEPIRMEERAPDADGVISWLVVVKASVWLGNSGGSVKAFGINTNGDDLHAATNEAEEAALDRALALLGIPYIELGKEAPQPEPEPPVMHAADAMRAKPPFGMTAPPTITDKPFEPGVFDANGHPLRPAKETAPGSGHMDAAALKADIVSRCKALDIDITGRTPSQVAEMLTKMRGAKVKKEKDGSIKMPAIRDALLALAPSVAPKEIDPPLPEELTLEEAMS